MTNPKTGSIAFSKLEGTGNDFVLLDFRSTGVNFHLKPSVYDFPGELKILVKAMSDRHFGVGADQILILSDDARANLRVQFFNSDGSEAEMCGNGLRAVGVHLAGIDPTRNRYQIQTMTGEQSLLLSEDSRQWEVQMGIPKIHSQEEKLTALEKPFTFRRVSMGNPHAVIFGSAPSQGELKAYGSVIECHELFPERTNVEFVEVISPSLIRIKVWERGAGATLSCGSGACAAVAAGIHQGLLARDLKVEMPGGMLSVSWKNPGEAIRLSGPANLVFIGQFNRVAH